MEIITHAYWYKKQHFLFDVDTYEQHVLFAVQEGSFHYTIGDQSGIAKAGSVISCPPHHAFYRKTVTPVTFHYIQFSNSHLYPWLTAGMQPVIDQHRLLDTMTRLAQVAQLSTTATSLMTQHLIQDIVLVCLSPIDSQLQQSQDEQMNEAIKLIRKHACQNDFQLNQVAEQLQLTPVQLTRRFTAAFQQTPVAFATSVRINQAKQLLTETRYTLDKIAEACGYESSFYLSRIFKKTTSLNPSEYRKAHQL